VPWPLTAQAQPAGQVRSVAWLGVGRAGPAVALSGIVARGGLREHGWVEGRNLRLGTVWAVGLDDMDAAVRVALATSPDVVVTQEFMAIGPLMTYGPNVRELYRSLARYTDRILRGAKPADLPVEVPAKVYLAINLKTAKALGLESPARLLTRADEVIE